MNQKTSVDVVVTGDLTVDWTIHPKQGTSDEQQPQRLTQCAHICWHAGGAMLLADLIRAAVRDSQPEQSLQVNLRTAPPIADVHPDNQNYHHTYAQVALSDNEKSQPQSWRVSKFLGLHRQNLEPPVDTTKLRVSNDTPDADILVFDDPGLGFRDNRELWPAAVTAPSRKPWVLLKAAGRVAEGALWEHLRFNFADRLIVVTTVDDLRRSGANISQGLSWERTVRTATRELLHNPRINALSYCAYVVVSFGAAGAMLLTNQHDATEDADSPPALTLFFDPKAMEDNWARAMPGRMFGYSSVLAAAIARQLTRDSAHPDLHEGIRSGLAGMRKLHREGFVGPQANDCATCLRFPIPKVAEAICTDTTHFAQAIVPQGLLSQSAYLDRKELNSPSGYWTILDSKHANDLDTLAEKIVVYGPDDALKDVPLGRFKELLTVDRKEIESLRSIRTLVDEYTLRAPRSPVPLSIAVFGAPGSGKSFTVTQVISSLLDEKEIKPLTFNLAQFNSPDDLVGALHQVRDASLSGKIPLVFWDEIDTRMGGQDLGWLRYFLAPMQDGEFQEGQIVHPIGRSIFVFAGGQSRTLEQFRQAGRGRALASAKVPDFLSRLRGYIEILGPNAETIGNNRIPTDPFFMIRRALLLRSMLQRKADHVLRHNGKNTARIDSAVLRAFLTTSEYKHGARSMEAIIDMSMLAKGTSFDASSLPARAQLDLHVDGEEFLSLVRRIELPRDTTDAITGRSQREHSISLESRIEEAMLSRIEAILLVPLQSGNGEKQVGRLVHFFPGMLSEQGYRIVPARQGENISEVSTDDIESLARLEHARWKAEQLATGWRQDQQFDSVQRTDPALKEWDELTEPVRELHRNLVKSFLQELAREDYDILKFPRTSRLSVGSQRFADSLDSCCWQVTGRAADQAAARLRAAALELLN